MNIASPMPLSYELFKPNIILVAAILLTTLALHFPPKLRPFFLPPAWLLAAWSFTSVQGSTTSGGLIGLESYTAITCIIHMLILPRILYFEIHSLLSKTTETGNPTYSNNFALPPNRSSLSAACWIWNNPRHLSRQRLGPGTAPWPKLLKFALFRICKIGIIVLIDRAFVKKASEYINATSTIFDFTPDQEPILRRLFVGDEDDPVSGHQLLLRAFVCVSWIWTNILILESCHAILSLLFVVILRFDDPEDWPPLFGNPTEAWTVRRFWGRFWHRIASPTFYIYAKIFSQRILKLKPSSAVDKAIVSFGIFFLSGLIHAITAWKVGQGEARRDLLFFCSNYLAVGGEIFLSTLLRNLVRKTKFEELLRDPRMRVAGKALGFIWVFAWFFWSAPRWLYPKTLRWSLKQAILRSRT
ncbi:membrane bound O-acyl transferase family-domain-containing protein [Daldinia loculata]|nr:membrane bound O-acyl transferase family-domain-containing protein [Daldinia loculata]